MVSDSDSLLLHCAIMHESVFLCGRALLFITGDSRTVEMLTLESPEPAFLKR